MIQRLIHRFFLRRHFWRYATFSEVAELYASRTMRLFALRMVVVFTSIYLLQEGYSLLFLTLFWAGFNVYRAVFAWPAALMVARLGPKHGTLVSNILAACSMLLLPFIGGDQGLWILGLWCVLQASSTCLYDISYLVDFSKVKSTEHAGKEIAFMNIFEKLASGISPVVGGVLAFVAGPHTVMIFAALLFLLAALPLFQTAEPTRLHQKISFQGFPWRLTWRSLVAESAVGVDLFAAGTVWTLFMALIVFAGDGNEIYAKVGLLSAVSLVAALVASYTFGKLIDRRRGRELLQVGALANSFVHFMRAFVSTPTSVVFANVMNEGATTAFSMAFTRGLFDTADASGKRIAYLFLVEVTLNIGCVLAALLLALMIVLLPSEQLAFQVYFVVVAILTLLIATPRFALYRK